MIDYSKPPDLSSFTESEVSAWHHGYNFARVYMQKKIDERNEAVKRILLLQDRETRKWREAGLTYDAIRDLLNKYETSEISFGKLVEDLRGLASAALEKLTKV